MISIIIPAYNNAKELPKTLESVFKQDYKDIEVIVVNDGSTDSTEEVVKPYLGRITYIKQDNSGAPKARNRGFAESRGEYVMFLDADIKMRTHCITDLIKALQEHPEASYVYPSFLWGWKEFKGRPFSYEELKKMNYIHTSALIRRRAFPGFDESLKKFQDWDLWLTMAEKGSNGIWVDKVLYQVAPHKGGMSSWLPKIAYKIPWKKFGITIPAIDKYEKALTVIRTKHGL